MFCFIVFKLFDYFGLFFPIFSFFVHIFIFLLSTYVSYNDLHNHVHFKILCYTIRIYGFSCSFSFLYFIHISNQTKL